MKLNVSSFNCETNWLGYSHGVFICWVQISTEYQNICQCLCWVSNNLTSIVGQRPYTHLKPVCWLPAVKELFSNDFCVGFPTLFQRQGYLFIYLFVHESKAFVTWFLLGVQFRFHQQKVECFWPAAVRCVITLTGCCFFGEF